jgi:hypothetical protein
MKQIVQRNLCGVIELHQPKAGNACPSVSLERLLRMCLAPRSFKGKRAFNYVLAPALVQIIREDEIGQKIGRAIRPRAPCSKWRA